MIMSSVPIGKDDSQNVEIEKFGDPFVPDFENFNYTKSKIDKELSVLNQRS